MDRCVEIEGRGSSIVVIVDGRETGTFALTSSITALDLYAAFDYHAGDRYSMGTTVGNEIPEHTITPFADMVSEIIEGLNGIECRGDDSTES